MKLNKKFMITYLALMTILLTSSCAKKIERYIPETTEAIKYNLDAIDLSNVSQNYDYNNQIKVLADNVSVWAIPDKSLEHQNGYCVTDLDNNGRLEIIVSQVVDKTKFVTNKVYEVNDNLEGISLVNWIMLEGSSGVNIMVDKCDAYINHNDNSTIYILKSISYPSTYEPIENISAITMANGVINQQYLAFKNTTAVDNKKNIDKIPEVVETYVDRNGNVIDSENYDLMEANLYGGRDYTSATATFNWLRFDKNRTATASNISSYTGNNLINKLTESFDDFHIILN